jgi:serine/threonine protein kinase
MAADVIRVLPRFAFLANKFAQKPRSWLHACTARDLLRIGLLPEEAVPLSVALRKYVHDYDPFVTTGILCDLSDKTVYVAHKLNDPGEYALKAIDSPNFDTWQELYILQQIVDCECVPQLVAHGVKGSHYYIVTTPVGTTLSKVARCTPPPSSKIMHWGIKLWLCLCDIHSRGVFHRDIKPDNIILVNEQVQLIDFGGAESLINPSNVLVSTIRYRQSNWKNLSRVDNDLYGLLYSLHALEVGVDTWENQTLEAPDLCDLPNGVAKRLFKSMFADKEMHSLIVLFGLKNQNFCV